MAPKNIPLIYTLFFLYLEPLSLLAGVYYTLFSPQKYLEIVHAIPTVTSYSSATAASAVAKPLDHSAMVLVTQLANVYFLFFLTESLVLRATSEAGVWKVLMAALMVADVGHLTIVWRFGGEVAAEGLGLAAADWAKPAVMMVIRGAFLLDVGMTGKRGGKRKEL
ncbi:MAG: hypothetical protein MMC33_005637 [Icmadophila ericetorum]|nr:hypothetical protein [Icmadophila ericetorum]